MNWTTQQRHEFVIAEVAARKHVTVRDLALAMAVSEATVRRDLKMLSDSGDLQLVHGGATLPRNPGFSFRSKAVRNVDAKRVIGQLAADLVADDEQIFIDSGTTCFEMLPALKRKHGLSIIANSARLALELDTPGLSVIMLGGQYRQDRMDTIGPLATSTLEQLRGYMAFIGADGVSMDFGVTAADIESAHLYRLAAANARETTLLIDHTKFLAPSLFKIVEWSAIARVVTDLPPQPQWVEFFQGRGIRLIYPEPGKNNESPAAASIGASDAGT